LEAIRGDLTLAELAAKQRDHHTMIAAWKRQAIDGMASTFSGELSRSRIRYSIRASATLFCAASTSTLSIATGSVNGGRIPGQRGGAKAGQAKSGMGRCQHIYLRMAVVGIDMGPASTVMLNWAGQANG